MKNLISKTGLTSKELSLIAFLILTFAAGLIIKYSGFKKPGDFDYSESDKNFEKKISDIYAGLNDSPADSIQKERAKELSAMAESLGIEIETRKITKSSIKPGTVININTAAAEELTLLPGIGEVMASNIIEYRENRGGFKTTDELKQVKGIGEKKFVKIKEYISVR